MELILTEEEKAAATWLQLDNESVGMVCKKVASEIKIKAEEQGKMYWYAAGMILAGSAAEANAEEMKQTLEGLTLAGSPIGDWEISVKRKKGYRS